MEKRFIKHLQWYFSFFYIELHLVPVTVELFHLLIKQLFYKKYQPFKILTLGVINIDGMVGRLFQLM